MTEHVPIKEAAERLGVSADTIRRRLKNGDILGEKRDTPQGYMWYVEIPEIHPTVHVDAYAGSTPEMVAAEVIEIARLQARIEGLERLVDEVQQDRDAWRGAFTSLDERRDKELTELREALMQAQAITMSLPARMAITEQSEPAEVAHQESVKTDERKPAPDPAPPAGFLSRLWHALGGS